MQSAVVLSPDATQAAFSCEAAGVGPSFRVVRTDPAAPRQRRIRADAVEAIEWSQPRTLLVLLRTSPDARASLATVDIATGNLQIVTRLDAPIDAAPMSPDGAWIAFDGPDRSGRHDVFVVASSGGVPIAVASGPSDDSLPGWSPDSRGVLFISDRTGSPGLWRQPIANGGAEGPPQLLSQDLGRVADVWAATREGAFIYFRQTGLVKVGIASLDDAGRATGTPSMAVTGQFGGTMMPGWSPDGRRLAYQAVLTGSRVVTLGVSRIDSGEERLLRTDLRYPIKPRWSPDGRAIVVKSADAAGRYGLYLVDPETGRTTPVKLMDRKDEDTLGPFRWAPDGTLVAIVGNTVVRIDVVTGAETPLFDAPTGIYGFDVSPVDGTVAFLSNDSDPRAALANRFGGVVTVRAPGGAAREVIRIPPGELVRDVEWMPDGRALLFTRTPAERPRPGHAPMPVVWRVDIASGTAQPIGLAMDRLRELAVSPDGRRLAFTTGAPLREPWVIENYLPPPRRAR